MGQIHLCSIWGAMAHIQATLFNLWVKARFHRRTFRLRMNTELSKNPARDHINSKGVG